MDATLLDKKIAAPNAGDDGEAMGGTPENVVPAITEAPVKPGDAGWFVAVVRCNCELKIADAIRDDMSQKKLWFEYWVPMRKTCYIEKRTRKRKFKDKTFLSTFIFCHVSRRRLNEIRFRPDVYKMLTMPGQTRIYQIPDQELDNYRHIVDNPDIPVHPHSGPLKKGQKVRVTEGTMAGVVAYVQRVSGKKAVIGNEIKYISGATIEIDRAFLEAIPE